VEEGSQSGMAAQTPLFSLCIHHLYLQEYFMRICGGKIQSFSTVAFVLFFEGRDWVEMATCTGLLEAE